MRLISKILLSVLFLSSTSGVWLFAGLDIMTKAQSEIEKKILLLGATKIYPDEYNVENQYRFALSYDSDRLSVVKVCLLPGSRDVQQFEDRTCCISAAQYKMLLGIIGKLKPLGEFKRHDPLRVIPTSGWIRRKEEYQQALVVISEKNCPSPDPHLGCGIDRFTVCFWMTIRGLIESKKTTSIPVGEPSIIEYYIKIAGRELSVSKRDYDRLQKGMDVFLRTTADGGLTEIISITSKKKIDR